MSTWPEAPVRAGGSVATPAVYSPIPQLRSGAAGGGTTGGRGSDATSSTTGADAGYAAGYAAGWARGTAAAAAAEQRALAEVAAVAEAEREAAAAALARALAALAAAAAAMRAHTVPTLDAQVDVIAAAAIDIAEHVVAHEVAADAERGHHALLRALAAAPEHEDVTVRLAPTDLAQLGDLADPALAGLTGRRVSLVADERVRPGDAVAEYPGGRVDARITTALARVRTQLRGGDRTNETGASS